MKVSYLEYCIMYGLRCETEHCQGDTSSIYLSHINIESPQLLYYEYRSQLSSIVAAASSRESPLFCTLIGPKALLISSQARSSPPAAF